MPKVTGSSMVGPPSRMSSRRFPGRTWPLAPVDRRHIGADGAQVVSGRGVDQGASSGRVGRDRGVVEMGGPAAIGAAIDYGAVADAVGGHHDRPGDFDFLFERRCHCSLTFKKRD